MRLIDADALMNTIENACYANHNVASLSSVCGAICDIIDHEKTHNTWVKCSDRMPNMEDADASGKVVIWLKDGLFSRRCRWNAIRHYENTRGATITHWMTPPGMPGCDAQ